MRVPSKSFLHLEMGDDISELIVSTDFAEVLVKMQSPGHYPHSGCPESESWVEASENIFL